MKLTKNFFREEFACPHCNQCPMDRKFIRALQDLRDYVGKPITVLSGYRCSHHNIEIGGSTKSYHRWGRAADVRIECCDMYDMVHFARLVPAFENGGIGIYDGGFIHLDNRPKKARWGRIEGKYVDWDTAFKSLCKKHSPGRE